ncbi:snapalysin family zinc-dependent metalloprotease [Streptomyces sp. PA03-5A]|nr:snapalysin family zinc-dependent metalloprotease [Streptomyces sp. PA03-5A]
MERGGGQRGVRAGAPPAGSRTSASSPSAAGPTRNRRNPAAAPSTSAARRCTRATTRHGSRRTNCHILGLDDKKPGPRSSLMSGSTAGTSCHSIQPDEAERSAVEGMFGTRLPVAGAA